jgi:hypothetical protein
MEVNSAGNVIRSMLIDDHEAAPRGAVLFLKEHPNQSLVNSLCKHSQADQAKRSLLLEIMNDCGLYHSSFTPGETLYR